MFATKELECRPDTLKDETDLFVAELVKTHNKELLMMFQKATHDLVKSGVANSALKEGDIIPDFSLPGSKGEVVNSADLREKGPVIVTFFRGSWCGFDKLQLKTYQKYLSSFEALGATMVAVSPMLKTFSLDLAEKYKFTFDILSDRSNVVARQFGLCYPMAEQLRPIYKQWGVDIPDHSGDESYEIPITATYVVARDGEILYAFVDANARYRAEPKAILDALTAYSKGK